MSEIYRVSMEKYKNFLSVNIIHVKSIIREYELVYTDIKTECCEQE